MNLSFVATKTDKYIYIYNIVLESADTNIGELIFAYYDSTIDEIIALHPKIYPNDTTKEEYNFKFDISNLSTSPVSIQVYNNVIDDTSFIKEQLLISEQKYRNNIDYYTKIFSIINSTESTNENFEVVFTANFVKNFNIDCIEIDVLYGKWEGALRFQYYDGTWSGKYYSLHSIDHGLLIIVDNIQNITYVRAIDDNNNYKTIKIQKQSDNVLQNRPVSSISPNAQTSTLQGYGGNSGINVDTDTENDSNMQNGSSVNTITGTPNEAIIDFSVLYNSIKEIFQIADSISNDLAIASVFIHAYLVKNLNHFSSVETLYEYVTPDGHRKYSANVAKINTIYNDSKTYVLNNYKDIKPKTEFFLDKESEEYKRVLIQDVTNSNVISSHYVDLHNIFHKIQTILAKYNLIF